jgi:hypothetical protein
MRKKLAALEARSRCRGQADIQQAVSPDSAYSLVVKLDRLQFYCDQNPTKGLMAVQGFKSVRGHRIAPPKNGEFRAYDWVHWFKSRKSGMKFLIESQRREAWLRPYRLTLYADDRTGLLPDEVFSVLEVLPDFKLTMVELAFDFAPEEMTRKFVRERVLFGKSRPVPSVNGTDYLGTRRGSKRVQIYVKEI